MKITLDFDLSEIHLLQLALMSLKFKNESMISTYEQIENGSNRPAIESYRKEIVAAEELLDKVLKSRRHTLCNRFEI